PGHEVRALARDAERAAQVRHLGAEPVVADLFDEAAMRQAVAGSEAVLHLATRIPPIARMRRRGAWRDNDRLRTQGAAVLVNAALAGGAHRLRAGVHHVPVCRSGGPLDRRDGADRRPVAA